MNLLAETTRSAEDGSNLVGILGAVVLVAYGLWGLGRRIAGAPVTPDPWDAEVAAAMDSEQARPLCHRCLTPHETGADFCAECGAAVGQYTNWLPYPYLLSVGHALRIGTSGEYRRSPLTTGGFLFFGLLEYGPLAPVYWLRLAQAPVSQPPPVASDE